MLRIHGRVPEPKTLIGRNSGSLWGGGNEIFAGGRGGVLRQQRAPNEFYVVGSIKSLRIKQTQKKK
jgi:hypothetical protein